MTVEHDIDVSAVQTKIEEQTAGGIARWIALVDVDGRGWHSLGVFTTERSARIAAVTQTKALLIESRRHARQTQQGEVRWFTRGPNAT